MCQRKHILAQKWPWLKHGFDQEVGVFLGPKIRISARKFVFCYRTPDFVDGPFVALGKTVDLALSDRFFDFSFSSHDRFRKKEPADA